MEIAMVEPSKHASRDADEITSRMLDRIGGRIQNLRIQVCEDGLILQGQSHSYYLKQLAQQLAAEISALPILSNRIVVN